MFRYGVPVPRALELLFGRRSTLKATGPALLCPATVVGWPRKTPLGGLWDHNGSCIFMFPSYFQLELCFENYLRIKMISMLDTCHALQGGWYVYTSAKAKWLHSTTCGTPQDFLKDNGEHFSIHAGEVSSGCAAHAQLTSARKLRFFSQGKQGFSWVTALLLMDFHGFLGSCWICHDM